MQLLKEAGLGMLERGLGALNSLALRRGRVPELPPHLVTGERGELAAYSYLRRRGFIVVARRWNDSPLPGDLDLIAWDGPTLCFIEVKTRGSREVTLASAAVDSQKRQILRRLARHYLRQLPDPESVEVRFDIVTVYESADKPPEIQLIPGAFGWSEQR